MLIASEVIFFFNRDRKYFCYIFCIDFKYYIEFHKSYFWGYFDLERRCMLLNTLMHTYTLLIKLFYCYGLAYAPFGSQKNALQNAENLLLLIINSRKNLVEWITKLIAQEFSFSFNLHPLDEKNPFYRCLAKFKGKLLHYWSRLHSKYFSHGRY